MELRSSFSSGGETLVQLAGTGLGWISGEMEALGGASASGELVTGLTLVDARTLGVLLASASTSDARIGWFHYGKEEIVL